MTKTPIMLLVDGSSLLVTSYYATLPREIMFEKDPVKKEALYSKIMHDSKGRYTNAILGMMRSIEAIIDKGYITHMVVAFDTTRNTFRRDVYPLYKANRGSTPDPLKQQFGTAEKMLRDIGIKVLTSDTYEADDLVGSAASVFEKEMPCVMMTKDHDYLQLIGPRTRLWLIIPKNKDGIGGTELLREMTDWPEEMYSYIPAGAIELTENRCKKLYGHTPAQIIDIKAIGGDSSDNIPGAKGVSEQTALKLVAEYGSVEEIYKAIELCETAKEEKELAAWWKEHLDIGRSPIGALKKNMEQVLLSKRLATIVRTIPIECGIDECCLSNIDPERKNDVFREYDLKSLLKHK